MNSPETILIFEMEFHVTQVDLKRCVNQADIIIPVLGWKMAQWLGHSLAFEGPEFNSQHTHGSGHVSDAI